MGFNIAGILIDQKIDTTNDLKALFKTSVEYKGDVQGETALRSKDNSEFDVYANEKGTFILFKMGELYNFSHSKREIIQFMISDVSDTYFFEKHNNGEVVRKLIKSQGEIHNNQGEGIIDIDDDFMDEILEISNNVLGIENIFEENFKRYKKKSFLKRLIG